MVIAGVAAVAAVGVLIATMSGLFRFTGGTEETRLVSAPSSSAMKKDPEIASSQPAPRQPNQTGSSPPAKPGNPSPFSGTTPPAATSATASRPTPGGKQGSEFRVLFIVPATDFYWSDVGPVTRLLTESGCHVDLASWKSKATVLNSSGPVVPIPLLLTDVRADDYDALIIGGGPGIIRLTEPCDEADQAESIAKQMFASGKIICGLNVGPGVLAKMKLLDGVKATSNPAIQAHVRENYGVTLTNTSVEVSGQFVTGRDNSQGVVQDFADAILSTLNGRRNQP
jgi:putative intracellular protease/amidase